MDSIEVDSRLYTTLVLIENNDDTQTIWIKCYTRWAEECEKLGNSKQAERYRRLAERLKTDKVP